MKRAAIMVCIFLASHLASCASTANYPIALSYQPLKQYEKTGGMSVAVAQFGDERQVADKRVLGEKEDDAPFIAIIDEPAAALSKGIAANLENRGDTVRRLYEAWKGDIQSLNQGWGSFVIGGTLDSIVLNVKQTIIKTEYECFVKFTISIADIKKKELLHKEKFEVRNSYVTFPFSREKAEDLINNTLSDAVERAGAEINKYIIAKQGEK